MSSPARGTGRRPGRRGKGYVGISEKYGGGPGTTAAARRLVTAFFDQLGGELPGSGDNGEVSPEVILDVQLAVSELVSNAVRHTSGPMGLDLGRVGDSVEIAVWDSSPEPVAVMPRDPSRIGRHGMEIVVALCGSFDVEHVGGGKRITVRLDLFPKPR